MPRCVILAFFAAHGLAVVALAVAVGWTHNKPHPCRNTFERVRVGMTREEVEATVGGPPGDYSSAGWKPPLFSSGIRFEGDAEWTCNADQLQVWYTDDGRVREVSVGPSDYHHLPSRPERAWEWVTTGYDVPHYFWGRRLAGGPYDIDTLRDILAP